ncbi:unnamed protein product [Angiostrongylus costaricensis]|uniref:Transposase n=1 Tax=Angiostrongylus costaricensis TaxID=334426 RepID=A0A0R3PGR0_ANGCS|nr:unnamed protein product [Angiostrongylus costaricensis]
MYGLKWLQLIDDLSVFSEGESLVVVICVRRLSPFYHRELKVCQRCKGVQPRHPDPGTYGIRVAAAIAIYLLDK